MASPVFYAPPAATSSPSSGEALDGDPHGILLYYKYVPLQGSDAEDVARFYTELCGQLDLRGRIRVARDGVNVTVGGSMAALRSHAATVAAHPLLQGEGGDIDFKFAASPGSRNEATRTETKMDRLVVRLCEELVTLGPLARHRADARVSTAPHLTPEQFHRRIQRAAAAAAAAPVAVSFSGDPIDGAAADGAAASDDEAPPSAGAAASAAAAASIRAVAETGPGAGPAADADSGSGAGAGSYHGNGETTPDPDLDPAGPVVLLDARNIYETRIGHFDAGPFVPLLDPRTRCFSDLPAWLDEHEAALRNRTVLMYCTGGVRCERASAYLREKGPEFSRVFQLSGGIQRYLERFPDGGFFRGKNFLYDDRIAVGPQNVPPTSSAGVVGRCCCCDRDWDDYGARLRCIRCRLLVLLCDDCNAARLREQQQQRLQQSPDPAAERSSCQEQRQQHQSQLQRHEGERTPPLLCELCSAAADRPGPHPATPRGATLDSPAATDDHTTAAAAVIGGIRRRGGVEGAAVASSELCAATGAKGAATATARTAAGAVQAAGATVMAEAGDGGPPPRRLRILCLHGFRQTAKQFQGRTCALRKKLRDLADFLFVDGPHSLPLFIKAPHQQQQPEEEFEGGGSGGADTATERDVLPGHNVTTDINGSAENSGDADAGACHSAGGGPDGTADAHGGEARRRAGEGGDEADGGAGQGEAGVSSRCDATCSAESELAVRPVRTPPPQPPPARTPLSAKRAWLLPPELYGDGNGAVTSPSLPSSATAAGGSWQEAPSYVDELQYTRQTEGWRESLAALQSAVRQLGPFDGVFGFSQGASMAAVLCALQQRHRRSQHLKLEKQQQQQQPFGSIPCYSLGAECPVTSEPIAPRTDAAAPDLEPTGPDFDTDPDIDFGFRFAILASGFPSPVPQHRQLLEETAPLELPSLHVYGTCVAASGGGGDRQISPRESEALAVAFSCGGGRRRVLCHQSGHRVPATKGHVATFRTFLAQFIGTSVAEVAVAGAEPPHGEATGARAQAAPALPT